MFWGNYINTSAYFYRMQITVSSASKKEFSSRKINSVDSLNGTETQKGQWLDFQDYTQEELKTVGTLFHIDPLTLEDIMVGKQRIKIEDYGDYLFAVSKGVHTIEGQEFESRVDEVFMVLTPDNILTFHTRNSKIVNNVSETLRNRAKTLKTDSIFTSLVTHLIYDFSVDSFYSALSDIENWLSSIRTEVMDFDSLKASALADVKGLMSHISKARREMSELRIMLSQHRDVMSLAERGTLKFLSVNMMSAFRDIYDHTFQLIETVDSYIMRTGDVRDLYFTLRSAFTDNILRLLTIVATIFLPLTFLTGFYGMNFTAGFYQPASGSVYGFYILVSSMFLIAGVLLLFFRKRGWL